MRSRWVRRVIAPSSALLVGAATLVTLAPGATAATTVPFAAVNCPSGPATPQTWKVPPGVTSATFDVRGAGGGNGFSGVAGGSGAKAQATISVTPGETLEVRVGCGGGAGGNFVAGSGGYNGGAPGGVVGGGGGGGASDVRRAGTALVVAGGGGGAGSLGDSSCNPVPGPGAGGNGGGGSAAVGTNGGNATGPNAASGGGASGDNGGGAGSGFSGNGSNGGPGSGGAASGNSNGGGGGGGVTGGGGGGGGFPCSFGGAGGGGGGGSGLCPATCVSSSNNATAAGTSGSIAITFTAPVTALALVSGSPQSANVGASFAPLVVKVTDVATGNPVAADPVTCTAPSSGPSVTFSGTGTNVETNLSDANGIASTSTPIANGGSGSYAVVCTGSGAVTFALTNISAAVIATPRFTG